MSDEPILSIILSVMSDEPILSIILSVMSDEPILPIIQPITIDTMLNWIMGWYFKVKNQAEFRYVWTLLQSLHTDPYTNSCADSDTMQKSYTVWTDTDGDTDEKLQWKLS